MAKKCKISDWSCIYHACMSDDCQKEVAAKEEPEAFEYLQKEYGPRKCEINDNGKEKNLHQAGC